MLKKEAGRRLVKVAAPVTREIFAGITIATHWLCLKTCPVVNFPLRAEGPTKPKGWRRRRGYARAEGFLPGSRDDSRDERFTPGPVSASAGGVMGCLGGLSMILSSPCLPTGSTAIWIASRNYARSRGCRSTARGACGRGGRSSWPSTASITTTMTWRSGNTAITARLAVCAGATD
jgi:hypothetical protein